MIDLSEKRLAAVENRIPATIWLMLSLIAIPHLLYPWLWPRQKILAGGVVIPLMVAIVHEINGGFGQSAQRLYPSRSSQHGAPATGPSERSARTSN